MTFIKIMIVFFILIFFCFLGLIFVMLRQDIRSKKDHKSINFEDQDQYYASIGERITMLERNIEEIQKIVAKQK